MTRRLLYTTVLLMMICPALWAAAFEGSAPESGKSYYLYNIYQAKFLSWGNNWNTQASLDNQRPIKCTLNASNFGFTINTHCQPVDAAGLDCIVWNEDYDNYLNDFLEGGTHWPVVNANYLENGTLVTRKATVWTIKKHDTGYYQLSSGTRYLAYNERNQHAWVESGWACELTSDLSYAPDRSYWVLVSEEEYAAWMAKKKIVVASLNVDGMPRSVSLAGQEIKLNPDAKEAVGATAIGQRLLHSGFDVVGVSEDFNFHSEIWNEAWNGGVGTHYNATTHQESITVGNASLLNYFSQKPLFDTDGLCLFYKEGTVTPSNESMFQWSQHYGYTDDGADGLIKKGYRFYVITLEDGTQIDLYTLHMDAEISAGDLEARASQLTQLANAIKATHNGRPVIIIGDTNCRYTRDKVKELLIDAINADERFTIRDPWIQYGRANTYPKYGQNAIMASENGYLSGEVVDKIFYINNTESNIRLVAESYAQDLSFMSTEVDESGAASVEPLCDHKPAVVTFSYHSYDPTIDDMVEIENIEEAVYLRNVGTGKYLMNGGWWGSHAVVGDYPKEVYIKQLPNGKYDISTTYGHITDAAYVDNNNAAEYITEWTLLNRNGHKVLTYTQNGVTKALTANDPTYFSNAPLRRYVTTAPLNVIDPLQQWEIVTQKDIQEEMLLATPEHPVNATFMVKAANFDRIDWNEHGNWKFTNNATSYVTDNGIGGADNNAFCNFNRAISTKTYGTISRNNTWDLYQELKVTPGYYIVTCQGFLQEGSNNSQNVKFYAWSNPEGSQVMNSQALASYLSVDASSRPVSGDQASAGNAFNQGLYTNELPVMKVGSDGKLVIGVKKDVKTKSNTTWTVVDNFQIFYLGTELEPVASFDVNRDGHISVADLTALIEIVKGNDPNNTYDHRAADTNLDSVINLDDINPMIEKLLGK